MCEKKDEEELLVDEVVPAPLSSLFLSIQKASKRKTRKKKERKQTNKQERSEGKVRLVSAIGHAIATYVLSKLSPHSDWQMYVTVFQVNDAHISAVRKIEFSSCTKQQYTQIEIRKAAYSSRMTTATVQSPSLYCSGLTPPSLGFTPLRNTLNATPPLVVVTEIVVRASSSLERRVLLLTSKSKFMLSMARCETIRPEAAIT